MGRRGRKRQLEVEARYWQLLQSGIGTVEACRQVGITRKTAPAEAGTTVDPILLSMPADREQAGRATRRTRS